MSKPTRYPITCDIVDKHYNTQLHQAIFALDGQTVTQSSLDNIQTLATADAVRSQNINGLTPLMVAARLGLAEVVELLLKAGSPVNQTGDGNYTAVHLATRNGHVRVVEILTQRGADINICDQYGISPEQFADMNRKGANHAKIADYLKHISGFKKNSSQHRFFSM